MRSGPFLLLYAPPTHALTQLAVCQKPENTNILDLLQQFDGIGLEK